MEKGEILFIYSMYKKVYLVTIGLHDALNAIAIQYYIIKKAPYVTLMIHFWWECSHALGMLPLAQYGFHI